MYISRAKRAELAIANTEVLKETFGEEVQYLETNDLVGFRSSLSTGKISKAKIYSWMKFSLKGVIKHASSFEKISDNKIIFKKINDYRFSRLGLGTLDYETDMIVEGSGEGITLTVVCGRGVIVSKEFMRNDENSGMLKLAVAALGDNATDEELSKYLSTFTYSYTYDIPEKDKDLYEGRFEVEIIEEGLAKVTTIISYNGVDLTEDDDQPYKYTYFPEDAEESKKPIGDAFVDNDVCYLSNDFRKRDYETLMTNNIRMKCIAQFREEDGDIINIKIERVLTELVGHFEKFDYFGSQITE